MFPDKYNLSLKENIFLAKKVLVAQIHNLSRFENCQTTLLQTEQIINGQNVASASLGDIQTILNLKRAYQYVIRHICRNQQCCLHFWLLLEDPFEQLSGIVKNVDRHGKPALFLIMPDSCLRIIQAKTKAVRRRKSVNNAMISYTIFQTVFLLIFHC